MPSAESRRSSGVGRRVGIVLSRFNPGIGEGLLAGALRALEGGGRRRRRHHASSTVPGALETPLALQRLAQTGDFDALVALGAVIRGETYHFEIVANESAAGVVERRSSSSASRSATASSPATPTRRRGARMRPEGLRGGAGRARDREPARRRSMTRLARAAARASSCCRASTSGSCRATPARRDRAQTRREPAAIERADQRVLRRAVARRRPPTTTRCVARVAPHLDRKPPSCRRSSARSSSSARGSSSTALDIPYRVVINEAVELAKSYGGTDGHRSSTACSTSSRRACAQPRSPRSRASARCGTAEWPLAATHGATSGRIRADRALLHAPAARPGCRASASATTPR